MFYSILIRRIDACFIFAICFFFSKNTIAQSDNPCNVAKRITHSMTLFHYEPKTVNDDFSSNLFNHYIHELDPLKIWFTQTDIDRLKTYEYSLDDEINNSSCRFNELIASIYLKQLMVVDSIIKKHCENPFVITKDENYILEPNHFAADNKELADRWRKRLKWRLLDLLFEANEEGEIPAITKTLTDQEPAFRKRIAHTEHKKIQNRINESKDGGKFTFEIFLNSICAMYDPHSSYFSYVENKKFISSLSDQNLSFGFSVVETENGELRVDEIIPGGPAWKSNELHKNDLLISLVDDKQVEHDLSILTFDEVSELVQGLKQMDLKIVSSEGITKVIKLVKEKMENNENMVNGYVLEGEKKIGYIALPSFYTEWEVENPLGCANDVAKEIIKLKQENIEGLILDLRLNGGGSLGEAMELAGIFIDEGPLSVMKLQTGKPLLIKDPNRGTIYDGPLIVMINGGSASASEALAATLKDYNRSLIVGGTSYGKASGQIILPLIDSTQTFSSKNNQAPIHFLKITIQKMYRVNGTTLQEKGLVPDVIIPDWISYTDYKEANNLNHLKSDVIDKKIYFNPLPTIPVSAVSNTSSSRIQSDSIFIRFKELEDTIKYYYNEKPVYSLEIKKYRQMLVNEYEIFDEFWQLFDRKSTAFTIKTNLYDEQLLQMDNYRKEFIEQILENISNDPSLEETYKIMLDLIKL